MKYTAYYKRKIIWTTRMAIGSLGVLIVAIAINFLREPLFGIKEGYAPHNLSFNFLFFLPSMLISLALGLAVVARTIKYWKTWPGLHKKCNLIGLSIPAIGVWTFLVLRIVLTD